MSTNRLESGSGLARDPVNVQVTRTGVMSIAAVLSAEDPPVTATFGDSIEQNRLQNGLVLNFSSTANLSARSREIIGGDVVEQTVHLLELPSSVASTKAIAKTHVEDASNPGQLSIILNKGLEQGYDMNSDHTEVFPAIVSIPRPNIVLTQRSRPYLPDNTRSPVSSSIGTLLPGLRYLNGADTERWEIDGPSKKRRIGN